MLCALQANSLGTGLTLYGTYIFIPTLEWFYWSVLTYIPLYSLTWSAWVRKKKDIRILKTMCLLAGFKDEKADILHSWKL